LRARSGSARWGQQLSAVSFQPTPLAFCLQELRGKAPCGSSRRRGAFYRFASGGGMIYSHQAPAHRGRPACFASPPPNRSSRPSRRYRLATLIARYKYYHAVHPRRITTAALAAAVVIHYDTGKQYELTPAKLWTYAQTLMKRLYFQAKNHNPTISLRPKLLCANGEIKRPTAAFGC
jgi:hypothetical protein